MSERLEEIKAMRKKGTTIFCDWEKEIDWLIEQVESRGSSGIQFNDEDEVRITKQEWNAMQERLLALDDINESLRRIGLSD